MHYTAADRNWSYDCLSRPRNAAGDTNADPCPKFSSLPSRRTDGVTEEVDCSRVRALRRGRLPIEAQVVL